MKIPKFRLLFFGSDNFSVAVLKYLLGRELCPIQVVTKEGSLLGKFSNENKLYSHRWPLNLNSQDLSSNIGLVASFGYLIDVNTVNHFKYGLFNIHPSLLPQYRGSTPVQAAIKDGISVTGCTVMRIPPIPKFDIGEIILQKQLDIKDEEYAVELGQRLAHLGAVMFEELLVNYERHISEAKPQDSTNKSYAKKLKPEDGQLRFKTDSSELISRKVRACTGFIELFTFCCDGLKVRLEEMTSPKEVEKYDLHRLSSNLPGSESVIENNVPPGTIYFHKTRRNICIKCSDLKWLAFKYATPSSKARMNALDFHNGYLSKIEALARRTDC